MVSTYGQAGRGSRRCLPKRVLDVYCAQVELAHVELAHVELVAVVPVV